jgi:hypothetical protein
MEANLIFSTYTSYYLEDSVIAWSLQFLSYMYLLKNLSKQSQLK